MKVMTAMLLFSIVITGCSRTYVLPVEHSESLREDVAIRVSKKALDMHGVDIRRFEASPYREDSADILAVNAKKENEGYVIWRQIGDARLGYSVSISRKDENWVCIVVDLK